MSFFTFLLLLIVFGVIMSIHLLNSDSRAGMLSRALVACLIERVARRQDTPDAPSDEP